MITRYKYAAGGCIGSPYSHFSTAGPMWQVETITVPEWVDGRPLGAPGSYTQRETERVVFNLNHPFFSGNYDPNLGNQISPGFSDHVDDHPEMEQPWIAFLMCYVESIRALEAEHPGITRRAGSIRCGDIQDRIGLAMRELGSDDEWINHKERVVEDLPIEEEEG